MLPGPFKQWEGPVCPHGAEVWPHGAEGLPPSTLIPCPPVTMKMGRQRGVGRPQRPYRKPSAARILRDMPDADWGQKSRIWTGGRGGGRVGVCILRDMPDADWGQKSRICVVRGAARKKIGRMGGRFGTSLQCESPPKSKCTGGRIKPTP